MSVWQKTLNCDENGNHNTKTCKCFIVDYMSTSKKYISKKYQKSELGRACKGKSVIVLGQFW